MTTRSASKIDSGMIASLTSLDDSEIKKFKDDYGIDQIDDLALLDKADIDTILGTDNSTFLKRRKLFAIVQFVQRGGSILSTTTMTDVNAGIYAVARGSASTSAPVSS